MKNIFLILTLICFNSLFSYGQANTDLTGPIPYRTLEQTIGETYIILPLDKNFKFYALNDDAGTFLRSGAGKSLKLIRIDKERAYFKDSLDKEYSTLTQGRLLQLTPLSDFEAARKLFIGKVLWLNADHIFTDDPLDYKSSTINSIIKGLRFEPVTVTNITLNGSNDQPLIFFLKTATGKIGYLTTSVSGTNTDLNSEYLFGSTFFTENPHLKYHFTPAVWQMVKAGYTEIGMPIDAFRLVMGFPKDIHTTQTAKGTTTQWVYGNDHQRYYYFTNGKLTAKQD